MVRLAVTAPGDAAALGSVAVAHLLRGHPPPTVAYWLAHAGRGRGLGTAAVRLLCAWAFAETPVGRLEVSVEIDNAASIRLAQRCGFTRTGPARTDGVRRDGAPARYYDYALRRGSVDGAAAPTDPNR